jgi:hypothetical protein
MPRSRMLAMKLTRRENRSSYWRAVALGADTLPLRAALTSILSATPLGDWLASHPDDAEFLRRLIRPIQWELDSISADQLVTQLRDQVGELYYSRNLPVIAAGQAVRSLTDLVFETAARPHVEERRLTRIDTTRILEEAAATLLLTQALSTSAQNPEPSQSGLVSELDGISSLVAQRADTVSSILIKTAGQPLLWIHGSNGVGKSMLARLAAQSFGGQWLMLDLRPVQKNSSG